MKNRPNRTVRLVLASLLLWCIASWLIARAYFLLSAEDLIRQATQESNTRAQDLAASITKNLNFLSGAADLLAHQARIRDALSRPGAANLPASWPAQAKIRRWLADPALNEVSRNLHIALGDLDVDAITVANAAGDCIASSGWGGANSGIGINIADRDYFHMNRRGKRGMQFAVGKVAHAPGLFFSSPVVAGGRFAGNVTITANISSLNYLIRQTDAYVADRNGVVLMARDQEKELRAVPGAQVNQVSQRARMAIYGRSDFREMNIAPWGDSNFRSLLRVDDERVPHIIVSREIPGGMTVYVKRELAEFLVLQQDRAGLFWVLVFSGALLILLVTGILIHLRAITRSKNDVEFQANHDALTQLPNRRLLVERLNPEIRTAQHSGQPLALLLIDLDGFKEVNDGLGHSAGDALLVSAAGRIRGCLRASDTVARFGGDEFVVMLPDCGAPGAIERITQCILNRLAEPFTLGPESANISASIGIVLCPDDAADVESLLRHADQAMYAAKHAGRNRFHYYTPALEEAAQKRRELVKELRQVLPLDQLRVYYQPIVELHTGALYKAEALVRWQHPVHGFIDPAEFIPLAESSGMISEIGGWVFRQAARQAQRWRECHDPRFQVSVNKSPVQFRDADWSRRDSWTSELRSQGLSGDSICVEITEGLLLHAEDDVKERLMEFSRMGIQVSIDDFGTGYSSLAYLMKFDIDYLKIDKAFVKDLTTSRGNLVLCETIITMAHSLELKVIAEGVETPQQRDTLAKLGCDYAQGYLFSPPVPPEQFEKLFAGGNWGTNVVPLFRIAG
jgi:diguanylate cyclase (GGDEF)-like protein